MYDEIKKNKRLIIITAFVVCTCAIGISLFFILTYVGVIFENGSSIEMTGYEGLKVREKYVNEHVGGEISTAQLNSIIGIYKKYDEETAFQKVNEKYPELSILLSYAYANPGEEDYFDFSSIDSADDFYKAYYGKIGKILAFGEKRNLSDAEEKYVLSRRITEPFIYSFTDQWVIFKNAFCFMGIILFVISIVVVGRVFSQEKENDMNKILCSISKNEIVRMGKNKLCFVLLLISVLYVISLIIIYFVILMPFDDVAWDSPIQIVFTYQSSIFDWTIKEYFFGIIIGGWIALFGFTAIVSIVDAYIQNMFTGMVVGICLAYLPSLFSKIIQSSMFQHVVKLHPLVLFDTDSFIGSYFSYGIGNYRLNIFEANMILNFVLGCAFIYIVPRIFRNRIST